ncbi:MAG: substrate-binding domain-containing protein [Vicinamibacterales bacterium]
MMTCSRQSFAPCLLLLIVAGAIVATGCARTAPPAKRARPLIGVTLLTQTHTFYKELEDALRKEAAAKNMDLVVVACEMDPTKQAAQLEDFVAQKVDAILAAPCDSDAIGGHLAGPAAANIPVFTVDIAAHGGKVISHIASDNTEGGRLAARTLAGLLNDQGRVIIIDHPEVASVQDRTRGFDEEMAKHPGITVVGRPSASGQRARAMSVMEDMLQAHRDLNGVFGINDDSALGALSVLEAAGRTDVVIVGFDATAEAQAAIRKGGALKADVMQYPTRLGTTAIDIIAKHLAGETVPAAVPVEVTVVTAATLSAPAR